MKFLVDVGVGKKVENWLKENGFDVLSVRDRLSRKGFTDIALGCRSAADDHFNGQRLW